MGCTGRGIRAAKKDTIPFGAIATECSEKESGGPIRRKVFRGLCGKTDGTPIEESCESVRLPYFEAKFDQKSCLGGTAMGRAEFHAPHAKWWGLTVQAFSSLRIVPLEARAIALRQRTLGPCSRMPLRLGHCAQTHRRY